MAGFRRMIKDPSALLHTYGCQAHHMNLLAKEIGSKMKVPIEKIVKVVKHLIRWCLVQVLLGGLNVFFRLWGQPMENSEHRWELKKLANLHFYTDN